jgi:cytochrome c
MRGRSPHRIRALGVAAAIAWATAAAAGPAGDPVRGAKVYGLCEACHSLDEDDVGPRHRGVVGRRAGSVAGYGYSPALRNAEFVWTPELLDRWLADPQGVVPGAKMFFALRSEQDRADVIAYLVQQR